MRRLVLLVVAVLLLPGASRAFAQQATPGSALASQGYPELRIKVTDAGFEAPAQIAAGRVLVVVDNSAGKEGVEIDLAQIPQGRTAAEMQAAGEATPEPGGGVAAWLYDVHFAGAPMAPPGGTAEGVVDLSPGDWFVGQLGDGSKRTPGTLTVTEGAAPAAAEPKAEVTVTEKEYSFSGLDNVPAGPQTWKVVNAGQQPHIVVLFKGPSGLTMDQVMKLLSLPENATPPPGMPGEEAFDFNLPGMGALGVGQTAWLALDLQPGTYVALCFVPDKQTGAPHAMMGMVQVFTVGGGAGSPAAGGAAATGSGVEIKGFAFNPPSLTVAAGTTVTWTNGDGAPHTVTADDGAFDSGRLDPGKTFSQTFDKPGTYAYHCNFHPNMKATIVVN